MRRGGAAAVFVDRLRSAALIAVAIAVLPSCQTPPTRAIESGPRFSPDLKAEAAAQAATREPIALTHSTVVIDVRRPFDFASSRIPRSVSLQWSDFTQPEPEQRGVLQADLFQAARRLARIGVNPDQPIVVVGYGRDGLGEEGRLAWMLRYLGVRNVRFASIRYFPGPFTSKNPFPSLEAPGAVTPGEPPARNAPIWKPRLDPVLLATRAELREVLDKNGLHTAVRAGPLASAKVYALIDARPAKDYLGKEGFGASRAVPDMGAINVPWTEFVDSKGRVDCATPAQLARTGVTPNKRIIAFDELGVGSAVVAIAMRACGFPDVANYAGGLRDFLSDPRAVGRD